MANRSLTYYADLTKKRSTTVGRCFIQGLYPSPHFVHTKILQVGTGAMFGCTHYNHHLWQQLKTRGDFFYLDNAYLHNRETAIMRREDGRPENSFIKISYNALQTLHFPANYDRLRNLQIGEFQPWKKSGDYILLCPPSDLYMQLIMHRENDWEEKTIAKIRKFTDMPIRKRIKPRFAQGIQQRSLKEDLAEAFCVVTYTSNVAIEGMLHGVPCFVDPMSVAYEMTAGGLHNINKPKYPDNREEFFARLAANQWSLSEMMRGKHWKYFKDYRIWMPAIIRERMKKRGVSDDIAPSKR